METHAILELALRVEALEHMEHVPRIQAEAILSVVRQIRADLETQIAAVHRAVLPPRELVFEQLSPAAILPTRGSPQASGADLYSPKDFPPHDLLPGTVEKIDTGLRVDIPVGYEGQVRSRSGLAEKGIVVTNSPGTVDGDYVGHVRILVSNTGRQPFPLVPGQRLAQFVLCPVVIPDIVAGVVDKTTARGAGGFGSTGL